MIERPDQAMELPNEGLILAIGPGVIDYDRVDLTDTESDAYQSLLLPGRYVLYGMFSGSEVESVEDGKKEALKIMRPDEIWAVIERTEDELAKVLEEEAKAEEEAAKGASRLFVPERPSGVIIPG